MTSAADHDEVTWGYEFTLDLCKTISRSTEYAKATDPAAFEYRGADLAYGIERELYITLVNNKDLRLAYRRSRAGETPNAVRLRFPFESDVVKRMFPSQDVETVPPHVTGARRIARRARRRLRERRTNRSDTSVSSRTAGTRPIVVLLHAAKFARFVRPVLNHLDPADVIVAWSTEDVSGELAETGVTIVEVPGRAPIEVVRRTMHGTDSPSAFDAIAGLLADVEPRAVLVVEGNHPWDEVANRASQLAGIGCFCLQQGWSPIVHNGFRNMTFESMFVWGAGFAELLEPFNPDQRFVSTGSPALDGLDGTNLHSPGLPDTTGRTVVSFFLQPTSQVLGLEGLRALQEVVARFSERHPSALALVREHPGFPLTEVERTRLSARDNVLLVPPDDVSLADVLRATDISVAIYSTTILESIASLVPPVVLNTTSMPRYSPDVAAAGAGVEVRDADAALSVLDRLVEDAAYRASFNAPLERFRNMYFSNVGQDAAAAVASILERVPA